MYIWYAAHFSFIIIYGEHIMKRIICLFLSVTCLIGFAACSEKESNARPEEKPGTVGNTTCYIADIWNTEHGMLNSVGKADRLQTPVVFL